MRCVSSRVICALFGTFLLQACGNSSDVSAVVGPSLTQSEAAAIAAMDAHMEGRNAENAAEIAAANNYPHVRIGGGIVLIYNNYEDFKIVQEVVILPNFDDSEWNHSIWDDLKVIQSSSTKVHVAAKFSRVNAEGDVYLSTDTFWIMTEQDNHWGIKMRSSFLEEAEAGNSNTNVEEAEAAALGVIKLYVDGLNDRDSEALAELNHYPLVFLRNVELSVFDTPEDYISYVENTAIKDLDYVEWQQSVLENVEVVQSSPIKVHLAMRCDHINVVGDSCGQQNELWVITKEDGRWAIRGRSQL